MKKPILLLTLIFSTMFPSVSWADWKYVSENVSGDEYYVDFDRIRQNGGYVYYWGLNNYLEPTSTGVLSGKVYVKADCKLFREQNLSYSFHKEPMGGGVGEVNNPPNAEWGYPTPNSVGETVLQSVCDHVK